MVNSKYKILKNKKDKIESEIKENKNEIQKINKKISEQRLTLKNIKNELSLNYEFDEQVILDEYKYEIKEGNISKKISFERYKELYKKWMKGKIREKRYKLLNDSSLAKKKTSLW